jgi:hypothetical protein
MDPDDMLSMPAATAARDALGALRRSGRQVVAIGGASAPAGLISVAALAREAESDGTRLADLASTASTVIREEAIPLVNPAWLDTVGVIRVAKDPLPLATICPVDHTVCRCDGSCANL